MKLDDVIALFREACPEVHWMPSGVGKLLAGYTFVGLCKNLEAVEVYLGSHSLEAHIKLGACSGVRMPSGIWAGDLCALVPLEPAAVVMVARDVRRILTGGPAILAYSPAGELLPLVWRTDEGQIPVVTHRTPTLEPLRGDVLEFDYGKYKVVGTSYNYKSELIAVCLSTESDAAEVITARLFRALFEHATVLVRGDGSLPWGAEQDDGSEPPPHAATP